MAGFGAVRSESLVVDVDRYIEAMSDVDGWFDPHDAKLFALLDDFQRSSAAAGDILEVGAYHGKSTILLGYMRRGDEELVVVDPWDMPVTEPGNQREQEVEYRDLSRAAFEENFARFHSEPPVVHQALSSDALPKLADGQYRFIHLDGSHEWPQVSVDVQEVLRLLAPDGIVAFDDLFVRHAPGVPAAVWPALFDGRLVPFATTNKLYAQRAPATGLDRIQKEIEAHPTLGRQEHTIGDHRVLSVFDVGGRRARSDLLRPYLPPVVFDSQAASTARRHLRAVARRWQNRS